MIGEGAQGLWLTRDDLFLQLSFGYTCIRCVSNALL